jgi:FtsH-binding integral membrane protein
MFVTGIASAEGEKHFQSTFALVPLTLAPVILTIRAWAVWEQDRRLTFGLPIFFVLCWAPTFVVIGLYLSSLKCERNMQGGSFSNRILINVLEVEKMPTGLTGCLVVQSSEVLYIAWILLMVYETGAFRMDDSTIG